MIAQKGLRAATALFGACVLFILFVYLFFPVTRLNAVIDGQLAGQGLQLSPGAVKSILPGIVWEQPVLSSSQGVLLRFDRVAVHPDWKSLLLGSIAVSSSATLGTGNVEINYGSSGTTLVDVTIHDVSLEEIPFFKSVLGARAAGMLWCEGSMLRSTHGVAGEVKLEIKNLSLHGVRLGAFPLPDVSGLKAQGMVKVVDGKGKLESFTLQGEGVYMRLSGDLPGGATAMTSPLNLSLEIMPKPDFLEKQKLVFMLLAKFAVSPGVYRIPVKGTFLKPEIL